MHRDRRRASRKETRNGRANELAIGQRQSKRERERERVIVDDPLRSGARSSRREKRYKPRRSAENGNPNLIAGIFTPAE